MSHRKQILVSTSVASQPDEDEVAVNTRMLKTLVLCAVRKLLAKTMSCGYNVTSTYIFIIKRICLLFTHY